MTNGGISVNGMNVGDSVDYGFYKGVTFLGVDGDEIILEDTKGNKKRVYTSLFKKYGKASKRSENKE